MSRSIYTSNIATQMHIKINDFWVEIMNKSKSLTQVERLEYSNINY